jgi:hypothetical protein
VSRLIALTITALTVIFVILGTIWPNKPALASAGVPPKLTHSSSTPEAAVENLLGEIGRKEWKGAYADLANRSEFTEGDFIRDLSGTYPSLRTYASLDSLEVHPLHIGNDDAQIRASLRWSTVVGTFQDDRDLHVIKVDDRWKVAWPLVKEQRVPPQVIPVNYLRWDVIYRGPEDDWGAQDVESPHVRIIDMHPVDRGGGVTILGEILNEDVVPAFVTVKSTLLAKDGSSLDTEDAFDKINHVLLPKQVTPFRIDFRNLRLSKVDSIRMNPSSSLISASADPVIEIEDQKLSGLPVPMLTGQLLNQSGQVVNVTHVLGTFYDHSGNLVWVSDDYANRALMPQTPVKFAISLPADMVNQVNSYRVVTSPYSWNRWQ